MPKNTAFALGLLTFSAASPARAADENAFRREETPRATSSAKPDAPEQPKQATRERSERHWTLAIEGFATAPTDVGIEAGVETPFGLRVFGDYGWVPAASLAWLRGASVSEGPASATVDVADAAGQIYRLKIGIRPVARLGLYLDAGYGRIELSAACDVTGSVTGVGSISGGYRASSSVDLWLAELGYEWKVENRLLVGLGLGFMGTLNARTTLTPVGAAVDSSLVSAAETAANGALESYGFLPTLSLRAGFNVL